VLDTTLLRVMKTRRDYYSLIDLIPEGTLDPNAKVILQNFGMYFEKFPSHDTIVMKEFGPRFKAWNPKLKQDEFLVFIRILGNIVSDADVDQRENIVQELSEYTFMQTMANLTEQFQNGELPDSVSAVTAAFDKYRTRRGIKAKASWIDTSIGELLLDEFNDAGLGWRLQCLRQSMRGLRPGDFGIVAARPDQGKTSFFASEGTFLTEQLPPDRNMLWLNNEGPGRRIIPRLYQAALGLGMDQMKELQQQGLLEKAYIDKMGRRDRIRVVDIHDMTNGQVETIIEDNNPGLIVYDMIDNIRGFGSEARTDLALEAMYQWARERSVKYDCAGLAASQISVEGDNMMFPGMSALKDSKTGKQGACDFQIMIGSVNDENLRGSRFIGVPKNKLRRPGFPSDPRKEVTFDGNRSLYLDIPIGE
jgi:replicative DNA helicase